jgi:hypothetical protein
MRDAALNHYFGMQRALYKGEIGFERHVGWCIIYISVTAEKPAKRPAAPKAVEAQIRQGVDAWPQLQDLLRELAALNKQRLIPGKRKNNTVIPQGAKMALEMLN